MSINLKMPYKIIEVRHKRYEAHYHIPAQHSLIVPIRKLGEEVSCEVRWENDNGELQKLQDIVFVSENLVPVNPIGDEKMYAIWTHYYAALGNQASVVESK